MKSSSGYILGLLVMLCDIVLWNISNNATGVLKYGTLIIAPMLLGAFWNRRLL